MKYLSEKDNITEVEKGIKNKFRWEWLDKEDQQNERISVWCRKIDVSGTCFCISCNKSIKYNTEGIKSLLNHSGTLVHKEARESVKKSQILLSFYPGGEDVLRNDEKRTVDMATRKSRAEALVLSFLAEHSLSFSLAPQIIELAKTLALDISTLNSFELSRTTASYKLKYGLAKSIKDEQIKEMKKSFFSLNVDESSNKASESILAVLVQYFSEEQKKVVLRHLASIKLPACNAQAIYDAIVSFFEENGIPWENLMSILMDSCNTMRGKKNGVESKIRTKKAPHLLNIDGETCHTANNCAKKFTEPFLKHLEILCDNIYFDLKSTDKRELFFQICAIIKLKPLKPLCRPDHRWLYVLAVIERLIYLWDALLLFYFSWIGVDAPIYEDQLKEIYIKKELSVDEINCIENIQCTLKGKFLTEDGKSRKKRIIQRLFVQRKKTLLYIGVYQSVLPHFNKYVKLFQSKECLLHELHVQMFNLTKQFLVFFIKHELISAVNTYQDILKIDTTDRKNYLPDKLILTGIDILNVINKSTPNSTVQEFMENVKQAYSRCAEYMKKKLPLKNSLLIKFSALNPALRGETTTFSALLKLAEFLPNVIPKEQTFLLDQELRQYQVDSSLSSFQDKSVTEFWIKVVKFQEGNKQKYPVLSKMIKAVLTCFHGPSVESTFNFMDDIMTDNRTSLNIESLDSLQTVKYYLNSLNANTCEVFGSKDPVHDPIRGDFRYNLINSWTTYQQSLLSKNPSKTISSTSQINIPGSSCNLPASPCSSLSPQVQISPQIPKSGEASDKKRKLSLDNKSKTKQQKIGFFFKK